MDGKKQNIALLILAAGKSSRMGRPKQLLNWKDTTLLGNAIYNAKASVAKEVFVVLGANAKNIKAEISGNQVQIIENPSWEKGLGTSIACGLKFLIETRCAYDAVLIMLADQPLIDTAYLNELMATYRSGQIGIIATAYKSRAGVPALFDKIHFDALAQLQNDFGAKEIIDKNEVFTLDPKDKAIDIDTESEYQNSINKWY